MSRTKSRRTTSGIDALFPKGANIYTLGDDFSKFIKNEAPSDWIIISNNRKKAERLKKHLKEVVINPGCLYSYDGMLLFNVLARSVRDHLDKKEFVQDVEKSNIQKYFSEDKIVEFHKHFNLHRILWKYFWRFLPNCISKGK